MDAPSLTGRLAYNAPGAIPRATPMKTYSIVGLLALSSVAHAQESAARPDPIAGYSNGNFFLRDPSDWFVLMPRGRLHLDGYFFPARGDAPAGVEDNAQSDPRP